MSKEPSGPVTRQAANRGNQNQSNGPPSSVSEQKAKTVPEHPLQGPVNDGGEVTTTERDVNEMA